MSVLHPSIYRSILPDSFHKTRSCIFRTNQDIPRPPISTILADENGYVSSKVQWLEKLRHKISKNLHGRTCCSPSALPPHVMPSVTLLATMREKRSRVSLVRIALNLPSCWLQMFEWRKVATLGLIDQHFRNLLEHEACASLPSAPLFCRFG